MILVFCRASDEALYLYHDFQTKISEAFRVMEQVQLA